MSVNNKPSYQICLVSEMLADGGAERCAALLSQYLEQHNCAVHHVITIDKIEYDYAGQLLNLGKLKGSSFFSLDRIHRFLVLRSFFKKNDFDFIIDFRVKNRPLQEYYIANYIYKSPLIVSIRSYETDWYFPKNKFLANTIYKKCYKIIAVSEKIKKKILNQYTYKNIETIYNSLDFDLIENKSKESLNVNFKYIIAAGRMNDGIKQFDKLIKIYATSNLPEKNIKLLIIGEGILKKEYELLAAEMQLQDYVFFVGYTNNPFKYYKNALFTVLSSKNEGFPNVLLESLACKTPVVAFDCNSGPSEIISNGFNGILVENQDDQKLTEALNLMIENKELYQYCKQNALESVKKFSLESIGKQWTDCMNINIE